MAQHGSQSGKVHSLRCPLPYDDTAPGMARRTVSAALTRWGLPSAVDACVLVASELVTNAVLHGSPPLVVSLHHSEHRLRLDVTDSDSRPAEADASKESLAESGRGLLLVRHFADAFGSDSIPRGGKAVHAEWDLPMAATSR